MAFDESDYLPLSGIQHFVFCRRQWALIHLEQQWAENIRTVEGDLLHKNAHDGELRTLRGDLLTVRAMRVHSARLGLSGECDVVEFRRSPEGVPLAEAKGLWNPYPVKYKRGKAKPTACDEAQLCAQAICLEEMLCCTIPAGALFYGQPRRRQEVSFTPELRTLVEQSAAEMHQLFQRGYTPRSKPSKGCNACSLKDLCLPRLAKSPSVTEYLRGELKEP
ncbi:MAG: CRISPR-associated protein Cas4 [Oscillospiraceae bacterium]|nr:CRISPR-associated protein Cas4 [Oscillospiraceae bacterium]